MLSLQCWLENKGWFDTDLVFIFNHKQGRGVNYQRKKAQSFFLWPKFLQFELDITGNDYIREHILHNLTITWVSLCPMS